MKQSSILVRNILILATLFVGFVVLLKLIDFPSAVIGTIAMVYQVYRAGFVMKRYYKALAISIIWAILFVAVAVVTGNAFASYCMAILYTTVVTKD